MSLRRILPFVVLVAACSPSAATTTTTEPPNTTTTSTVVDTTTTTTAPATTSTTLPQSGELILPSAAETMPTTWTELFFIPYGDTPDTLGTSLGGDGEGILWGPEYGAPAPDGSWWFLDVGKLRLAHFSATGDFVEEVPIPSSLLVQGMYFQWSNPRVMADGTLLAARLTLSDETFFLRHRDGDLDEFSVPIVAVPRTDDGETLYATTIDEAAALWAVDPVAGTAQATNLMTTPAGNRFSVEVGPGTLTVELPDAGVTREMTFTADEIGGSAHLAIEVAGDADGGLHFFILGFPSLDETHQLAGYLSMSADGDLVALEPMLDPFTASDPGTPARLRVIPGTTTPTFMQIGTDGVRVYSRG